MEQYEKKIITKPHDKQTKIMRAQLQLFKIKKNEKPCHVKASPPYCGLAGNEKIDWVLG